MFCGTFLTGSWDISRHVCGDQNRYFQPKTQYFPHPNHMCLCLNLTTYKHILVTTLTLKRQKVATYRSVKFGLQRQTSTSCTKVSFFYPDEYFSVPPEKIMICTNWLVWQTVCLVRSSNSYKKHTAATLSLSLDSWETVPDRARTPDTVR